MITEINDTAISIEKETIYPKEHTGKQYDKFNLHLKLAVPGGELRYRIDIEEEVYNNILFADRIIREDKKKK